MSSTASNKWLALALLAAAQFVVILDASIVNVAFPSIGADLNFSQENLSGSSTPTCSCSAASCCSAAGWRTSSVDAGCS